MSKEKQRKYSIIDIAVLLGLAWVTLEALTRDNEQSNTTRQFSNPVASAAERTNQGIYYNSGELNSCPAELITQANYYDLVDIHGNPLNPYTASGRPFNPRGEDGMATWFYPLGSTVRVTNLANGRSKSIPVFDRGPNTVKYPHVQVDLYRYTFLDLGGVINAQGGGSIQVKVEPVTGCTP